MIVVHDIFICKPGNASKVAKLFKEWTDVSTQKGVKVMTDMTGQFHRVIIAATFENLAQKHEGREIYYELKIDKMTEIDTWLNQFRKIMEEKFLQLDEVLHTIKNKKK